MKSYKILIAYISLVTLTFVSCAKGQQDKETKVEEKTQKETGIGDFYVGMSLKSYLKELGISNISDNVTEEELPRMDFYGIQFILDHKHTQVNTDKKQVEALYFYSYYQQEFHFCGTSPTTGKDLVEPQKEWEECQSDYAFMRSALNESLKTEPQYESWSEDFHPDVLHIETEDNIIEVRQTRISPSEDENFVLRIDLCFWKR